MTDPDGSFLKILASALSARGFFRLLCSAIGLLLVWDLVPLEWIPDKIPDAQKSTALTFIGLTGGGLIGHALLEALDFVLKLKKDRQTEKSRKEQKEQSLNKALHDFSVTFDCLGYKSKAVLFDLLEGDKSYYFQGYYGHDQKDYPVNVLEQEGIIEKVANVSHTAAVYRLPEVLRDPVKKKQAQCIEDHFEKFFSNTVISSDLILDLFEPDRDEENTPLQFELEQFLHFARNYANYSPSLYAEENMLSIFRVEEWVEEDDSEAVTGYKLLIRDQYFKKLTAKSGRELDDSAWLPIELFLNGPTEQTD